MFNRPNWPAVAALPALFLLAHPIGTARASPYTDTVTVSKNTGSRSSAMTNDAQTVRCPVDI
jgi:hypothetical protein